MEDVLFPIDEQTMVSSFLEIAVGQTAETARQFLQATSWKLDEAIQLFYVEGEGEGEFSSPSRDQSSRLGNDFMKEFTGADDGDDVRAPLPVIREALYDDAMLYPSQGPSSVVAFRNFEEERNHLGVWEPEQGGPSAAARSSKDNLAALYRPPFALMLEGPFEKAKLEGAAEDKWLLANLQSATEFSSHMLNRDTWANEAVAQTIKSNFIFWQVYDDTSEGKKVCTYYNIESAPVVLVIDPVTGQKMRSWSGMLHPDRLLEDLLPFMDASPTNQNSSLSHKRAREDEELQRALAASMESVKHPVQLAYQSLPEEPKGDKSLTCRVGFRLPDGRRVQRSFFRTDPMQLLWSFCSAQLGEEAGTRPFRLCHAVPGAAKTLEYDHKLNFDESGLSSSMISVTWQ